MNNINLFVVIIENRINAAPLKSIPRSELICISHLVFFSGIRKGEIGRLEVRDVVDPIGQALNVVKKFEKEIQLINEARSAVEKYYGKMKRLRPTQALRRKPFFPTYQNERKLSRHWKKVNTGYNEIHEAGIKYHFASSQAESRSLGALCKKGGKLFRITPREYRAVVHDKKIPSGTEKNDERCIESLLYLFEKAERITANSPTAKKDAENILTEAQQTVDRIKNDGTRNNYSTIIPDLKASLSKHL